MMLASLAVVDLLFLGQLLGVAPIDGVSLDSTPVLPWWLLHALAALLGAVLLPWALGIWRPAARWRLSATAVPLAFMLPVVGLLGTWVALAYAFRQRGGLDTAESHYQFTSAADLPYTTPRGREARLSDKRGFVEQLRYHEDSAVLHRKVLAAGHISDALAVASLKLAMQHDDERVRLTAYKTLDRKINRLNRDIQRLERAVETAGAAGQSRLHLEIASLYWELLTLEKDEPVARRQLLDRAASAAIRAVDEDAFNRNAHFMLGRISLLQGDTRRARIALERARALGISASKILPYLAELDFLDRDFDQVRRRVAELDPAFRHYPPLSQLVEFWA